MNRIGMCFAAAALVAASAPGAWAFGPAAAVGAQAVSGAVAEGEGGTGVGIGKGGSASGGTAENNSGDTNAFGGALGQALSALSPGGICGKENRFGWGFIQWSEYSDKCFNYTIAIKAAERGEWETANAWACRADGMTAEECAGKK